MNNTQDVRHILVIEDQKSKRIVSLKEKTYSIGRDPNSSIILYDRQVSRHHATLLRITDYSNQHCTYRIIDGNLQGKKSTNGLIINGKYTLSHELKHGDLVRFGNGSKASYHVISTPSEIDFLRADESESSEHSQSVLSSENFQEEPPTGFIQQGEDSQTVVIPQAPSKPRQQNKPEPSSFAEFSPNPIIEVNLNGEITYLNSAASIKFPDITKIQAQHPILLGLVTRSTHDEGTSFVREIKIEEDYFEQHIQYISDYNVIRTYIFDITRYKKIEKQLQNLHNRDKYFQDQSEEGIFFIDVDRRKIIDANQAICELLGYTSQEMLEATLYEIVALDKEIIDHEIDQIMNYNSQVVEDSIFRSLEGTLINVEAKICRIVYDEKETLCFKIKDIAKRKQIEDKLEHQALFDRLTDLPNRQYFTQKLENSLTDAQKNQTLLAVLFLDIDSFQNINHSFGHRVGDEVLKIFAKRLLSCVRNGDVTARWGSDEFTILLPRIKNTEDTVKLAKRIFEDLQEPFIVEGHHLKIKTSIGISVYPQDGENAEILLKNGDAALAKTKQQGRSHYQFYNPSMTEESLQLLQLETEIHKALDRRELYLYYQPQVRIDTGEVTGMEALLRWERPGLGQILPGKFIPLAEKSDIISHITKHVLQTACKQNREWQDAGLPPVPVTVNLSGREFQQPNLVEVAARILDKTGLDPQWLELEVTEMTLQKHLKIGRQIFQDCRNLGIRMALDDFGLGTSSVGHFKHFNFRTLKISQFVIRDLKGTNQETGILAALLALGRGFNLRVIAEGVETSQQLEILKTLNYQEVQGYLLSRPLRASEATQFLTNHAPLSV